MDNEEFRTDLPSFDRETPILKELFLLGVFVGLAAVILVVILGAIGGGW